MSLQELEAAHDVEECPARVLGLEVDLRVAEMAFHVLDDRTRLGRIRRQWHAAR